MLHILRFFSRKNRDASGDRGKKGRTPDNLDTPTGKPVGMRSPNTLSPPGQSLHPSQVRLL
jgi:hypothetical protein